MNPLPHIWFEKGKWRCALSRSSPIFFSGATPREAYDKRAAWPGYKK